MIHFRLLFTLLVAIVATIPATAQYLFSDGARIACTSVEDQESSNTCWAFATSAMIESELIRTGKGAFDLSEMYIVRQAYIDKAYRYLMRHGKANFGEGGLAHDVVRMIAQNGIIPEGDYPGRHNSGERFDHSEMYDVLKSVLDAFLEQKTLSDDWRSVVNAVLDVYLGPVPGHFTCHGSTYTPESFAEFLGLNMGDYVNLTSFNHHPFYQSFILDIPDNFANDSYYNVPLDELIEVIEYALKSGYSVVWDGDSSEKGFSAGQGVAILPLEPGRELPARPADELEPSQELRQKQFESFKTTDDHLMQIVGMATDQDGGRYFYMKNSWGKRGPYNGFIYMSESYLELKTIAISLHRDAIPARIAAKIDL